MEEEDRTFPFSRLREKVAEGRMRVSFVRCAKSFSEGAFSINTLTRPVGHPLPHAGEGENWR